MDLTARRSAAALSMVAALAAALLLIVLPTRTAHAGILVEDAPSCAAESLARPFRPWLDPAWYTPAPGGSFEAGAPAWQLTGGAAIVAGNEPWKVRGAKHSRALRLPEGSRGRSPSICVGLGHPTIRLFARKQDGGPLDVLRVDVLLESKLGLVKSLPIGVIAAGSKWSATLPLPVIANLLPLLPGKRTAVAFRFVPVGSSTWFIDDVEVDPWRGR